MSLLNKDTYIKIKKELENNYNITVDTKLEDTIKIIDYFNDGSDDDFIVNWETIEYENFRINDFYKIGHFSDGTVAYIYSYNFYDFCSLAETYEKFSVLYEEYIE